MKMQYYRHASAVEALLKDAVYDRKLINDNYECNGFGIAHSGSKDLYRGPSGCFIVHTRKDRGYEPPRHRILSLPDHLSPSEYLSYEAEHEAGYSPWYDMIRDDDEQPVMKDGKE